MKTLKILLIPVIIGLLIVPVIGCGRTEIVTEEHTISVGRGDLTVDITAVGNLGLALTEKLSFDLAGTIAEVLVEEGDTVEEGQVLASLEVSEWEDQIETLEKQVGVKERELIQAEINLKNAQIALEETQQIYSVSDIKVAQADLAEAERNLQDTLRKLALYEPGSPGEPIWQRAVVEAQARVDTAQNRLDAMLSGGDTEEIKIKKLQLELNEGRYEDAQKTLEDTQEELDETKEKSLEIVAPFNGFISKVNVEAGNAVQEGVVVMIIADPTQFEAEILVSETDIMQLQLGSGATVQVDALSGLVLPAEVIQISPTATIQSGVVNYNVKVKIVSLEALEQERAEARQQISEQLEEGEILERLQQAIDFGMITREQVDEMMKRFQEGGQMPFGPGAGQFGGQLDQSDGQQGQIISAIPEGFQLRQGLTVTVTVVIDERYDVLLVPNNAITNQSGRAYVQVLTGKGTEEETKEQREITVGISDWEYTEVIDGLIEGEEIIVQEGTAAVPTTQQGPQGMRIPGMGGFGR